MIRISLAQYSGALEYRGPTILRGQMIGQSFLLTIGLTDGESQGTGGFSWQY
jgi:hypothetical protein